MKTLFLATAAVAAFAAAPALAQTAPTGSIGATWNQVEADDFEADGYAIDGVVAGPVKGDWTVTFGAKMAWDDGTIDDNKTFSGQLHLTREFNGLRAGGFIAASDAAPGASLLSAGAEVQKYFDKATLTGAVSYGTINDLDADLWSVGVDGGYYVLPNLRLNANAAYSKIDVSGTDLDAYSYGAAAEYQINGSPMSVFASWDRTTLDDVDLDVDTLSLGVRFNFGGDLQQRERAGANLTRSVGGAAGIFALGL
ncbi:hypothetical protein [Brevundimonas sp.]|uniref:hypothetical protein n=1 Tax=Brevundimonas sp. TaxID=1871086 RepID=UPI0025C67059|nr:hypothetical protein [Brevundimonas sp.]